MIFKVATKLQTYLMYAKEKGEYFLILSLFVSLTTEGRKNLESISNTFTSVFPRSFASLWMTSIKKIAKKVCSFKKKPYLCIAFERNT